MRARQPVVAFGLSGASLILLTAAEVMTTSSLHDFIDTLMGHPGTAAPLIAICAIIIVGFLAYGVRKLNESMERRRERREEANLSPTEELLRRRDRERFLETLRTHCDRTTRPDEWLDLDLVEKPGLVRPRPNPSNDGNSLPAKDATSPDPALPHDAGTRTIADVYKAAGGHLLLVGKPGSGKTTLLRELADVLLVRARVDANKPLPVLLDLAKWARKRLPLNTWLVEELVETYHLDHALAESWVMTEEIVPLIDGLDEVDLRYRAECAEALNLYQREHPLVVTCRTEEFEALPRSSRDADNSALPILQMATAVEIRSPDLDASQIAMYLGRAGWGKEAVEAVCDLFSAESDLRTLYTIPSGLRLLLSPPPEQECVLKKAITTRKRKYIRKALVKIYVDVMLEQDRESREHLPTYNGQGNGVSESATKTAKSARQVDLAQVRRWLGWVADLKEPVFCLDELEPGWLPQEGIFNRYARAIGLGSVVIFGLGVAFIGAMRPSPLTAWLYGMIVGSAFTWFVAGDARLMVGVRWSKGWAIPGFVCGLLFGPTGGFVVWLFFALLALVVQIGDQMQTWQQDIGAWLRGRGVYLLAVAGVGLVLLAAIAPDLPAGLTRLFVGVVGDCKPPQADPAGWSLALLFRVLAGAALAIFTGFLPAGESQGGGSQESRDTGPWQDIGQTVFVSSIAAVGIMLMVGIDNQLAQLITQLPHHNTQLPVCLSPLADTVLLNTPYDAPFLVGLSGGIALAAFGGASALLRALLLSRLVGRDLAPSQGSYERFLEYAADHGLLRPEGRGYRFANESVRRSLREEYRRYLRNDYRTYLRDKYLRDRYLRDRYLRDRYLRDRYRKKQMHGPKPASTSHP